MRVVWLAALAVLIGSVTSAPAPAPGQTTTLGEVFDP